MPKRKKKKNCFCLKWTRNFCIHINNLCFHTYKQKKLKTSGNNHCQDLTLTFQRSFYRVPFVQVRGTWIFFFFHLVECFIFSNICGGSQMYIVQCWRIIHIHIILILSRNLTIVHYLTLVPAFWWYPGIIFAVLYTVSFHHTISVYTYTQMYGCLIFTFELMILMGYIYINLHKWIRKIGLYIKLSQCWQNLCAQLKVVSYWN